MGYGAHIGKTNVLLPFALSLIVAISFLLIADIDSPRGGLIRVTPDNLISLSQSLHNG